MHGDITELVTLSLDPEMMHALARPKILIRRRGV